MSNRSEPTFYVLVQKPGKAKERVDLTDRIISFEYEDHEKKTDLLKLTVDNWDLRNFDDPVWAAGNILIVTWGYPGRMAPSRECVIQKVAGNQVLTIEAQDKAVLMNKDIHNRVFKGLTRSQVVEKIAKAYGFDSHDIQTTERVFEVLTQARSSDAQFVKKLADQEGFEFYVDFDGFHWHKRRLGQKPLRKLMWYLPPDVGDIISFTVDKDLLKKSGKVKTAGRDPLAKKDVGGTGSNAETKRDALAPMPTAAISADDAVSVSGTTGEVLMLKNVTSSETMPTTETDAAQAKKEADHKFARAIQASVHLDLELVGDPGVFAKSVLEVRGLGRTVSGLYYVTQANHRIDSSGYKLKLKTKTDGSHAKPLDIVNPKSKADLNEKKAEGDPGKLAEVSVSGVDGTVIQYKDTGGREPVTPSGTQVK